MYNKTVLGAALDRATSALLIVRRALRTGLFFDCLLHFISHVNRRVTIGTSSQ